MELHQLRYLVAVVEAGTFTAAADRLHVSQSGVSAQLAKLERELGHALLERGPRGVVPTAAGDAVLPLVRAALDAVGAVTETAADLAGLVRGRVRLGMVTGCSIPPFLDALADFGRDHPGVELTLVEDDSEALQRRVLDGRLDLALVGYAGDPLAGLRVDVVVDEPVAVVVAADHPLARRRRVRLRDLCDHPLLVLTPGTGIRAAWEASCASADLPATAALEASSPETLLGLARRGMGVAVLSASTATGADGLVARPVEDAATTARLGVVWRTGPLPRATQVLLGRLVDALGGPRGTQSGAQQTP